MLDHTIDILRLTIIQRELGNVKANLLKAIGTSDRALALKVKQNLTSAENFIGYAAAHLQPPKEDNSGIPEREALQL